MKNKNYISSSQISQWLFCPIGYRKNYCEELIEKQLPNIYMVWGSAFHKALEKNYSQKIKSKKDLDFKEVYKAFEDYFSEGIKNCIIPPFANPETMLLTAENVLVKYMEEIAPSIKPKFVEYNFNLKLKKYPITIFGFIDLITEDNIIKDYKTVGKTTKKNWTQYKADDSIQLTFYAAAFRKTFLKRESGIEVDLIPRESKPEFITRSTKRTDDQIDYVLHLATVIEEMQKKKIFPPNLNSCSKCPFKDTCRRK